MSETNKIKASLQDKFPDLDIKEVEIDKDSGKSTLYLGINDKTEKSLAFLKPEILPRVYKTKASTITRDAISRGVLDLASKDPYTMDPKEAMRQSLKYYYKEPLVGSSINLLASLAAKGFEHDIDDPDIKNFYDTWAFDVRFEELLEWIFLEFFRSGNVYTYKTIAKYEPRVSTISANPGKKSKKVNTQKAESKFKFLEEEYKKEVAHILDMAKTKGLGAADLKAIETAAKKNIWSKGHLPVAYTVLNPELVSIDGNLLFNTFSVKLTLPKELGDTIKKPQSELTQEEKDLLKSLPTDIKKAAEEGKEIPLDSRLVGIIQYRKQPYERYARPKTLRIFDSLEYKRALREADLSTLDGISNYILKITIGNDEYPVTSQEELEAVSQLFNTPSKSFDVVWNHTLNIEKVVSPEIEKVLGQDKYKQVNDDITTGLAIPTAIIDGSGDVNAAEVNLITKGLMEEINYARRQITRWIYNEYRMIAEALGFDRFPKIRWDEGILKDTILYMSTLAQLVDRRMLSYRTALEALGFDYPNELQNMEDELSLVSKGVFGIVGSPFQQSKNSNIQDTQNSPTGTPSAGRPVGQPATKKTKETNPDKIVKQNTKNPKKSEAGLDIKGLIKNMSEKEYLDFIQTLTSIRQE